jgi:hypothetical protein
VHDHRYPFGTKAHVKLHAIALICAYDEGGEAVLPERCTVGPAMCEQERALE